MPKREYLIAPDLTAEAFARSLSEEEIKRGALEAYCCLDAIRIWDDRFRPEFGELTILTHRYDGDDPPDVTAVFERGQVDMEHTCVEPWHRRKADALFRPKKDEDDGPRQESMRRVIPASEKLKSTKAILEASNLHTQGMWTDVLPEALANHDLVAAAIKEKMLKCPDGAVIVLESRTGLGCAWTEEPVRVAFEAIRAAEGWERFALVLLARGNPVSYESAYFSASHPFEVRRHSPPPMTREEFLAAWSELIGGNPPLRHMGF